MVYTGVHKCRGLCTRPEFGLNGVPSKIFYVKNKIDGLLDRRSLFSLGNYCKCETCELFFTIDSQRNPKNGSARYCRCCKDRLRFKPRNGTVSLRQRISESVRRVA